MRSFKVYETYHILDVIKKIKDNKSEAHKIEND